MTWITKSDNSAKKVYVAYFPERNPEEGDTKVPKYIRLEQSEKGSRGIIFQSEVTEGAVGNDIQLNAKNTKRYPDMTVVNILASSRVAFVFSQLWNNYVLLMTGIIIAIAGAVTEGALKLGEKGFVWITLDKPTLKLCYAISVGCVIAGAIISAIDLIIKRFSE